jgi:hypothetical protein
MYQSTKFHGPSLTAAEVWRSAILGWLKLRDQNYVVEVTFNGISYAQNFVEIYLLFQNLVGGQTHK